ncbi:putative NAD-dependent malic enzyme 2 [Rickettsiales bacterium Ac37b]|nr:putative NAD-dependent malic enzyme 2 [Rickettsiales bacterium Ac37b]
MLERKNLRLEGLLPPGVMTLELQIMRMVNSLDKLNDNLQKYLMLSDLQTRNETLFYAVLRSNPAKFIPLIYTPTVGEACQKFDHIFHSSRGLYIPINAKGRVKELIANWPTKEVRFIVATDGERILGLGDLGVGGMGISIGKLGLYTLCSGIPPKYCMPVMFDVGTNNQSLLNDPLYLGLKQPRVRDEEYMLFIEEFVESVQEFFPDCCIQWEDFANFNAYSILNRFKEKICSYNDDIQGTAAAALAGIFAALKISKKTLNEQKFLFMGAGAAATGIASLIAESMVLEGMEIREAQERNILYDINGLITKSRSDITEFQKPFAHDIPSIDTFIDAINLLKPTGIIGVSTVPKLFNQQVIEAMAKINERPIIFPYSNPTSCSECTAEEAYKWSNGRAIFASGSPFPEVSLNGKVFIPGQGNNIYIFPAMGMAIFITKAKRVTQEMFIVAAKAVAELVTEDNLKSGCIYPPMEQIITTSLYVASSIANYIVKHNLASIDMPEEIDKYIMKNFYVPHY